MRTIWLLGVAGILALPFTSAVASTAIKDGGFEKPAIADGTQVKFPRHSTIGPWTVVHGTVALVSTDYSADGFQFDAKNSGQWLNLAAGRSQGAIRQQIEVLPNQDYEFSFDIGAVYDPNGKYGDQCSILVTLDGLEFSTFTFTATPERHHPHQEWKEIIAATFKFATTQHTFEFTNVSQGADCGLDNVRLKLTTP